MKKLGIMIALMAMVVGAAFAGSATSGFIFDNAGQITPAPATQYQTWLKLTNTTTGTITLTATYFDQLGGSFTPTPNTDTIVGNGVKSFRPFGTDAQEGFVFGPKPFTGAGTLTGSVAFNWTGGANSDILMVAEYFAGPTGTTDDPITGITAFPLLP